MIRPKSHNPFSGSGDRDRQSARGPCVTHRENRLSNARPLHQTSVDIYDQGLTVKAVIHTHAHLDHFLASGKMKEETGASLAIHQEDLFLWDILEDQCRMFGIPFEKTPPPDKFLQHEEEIEIDGIKGIALHTPGHTPGSVCFLFKHNKLLIAGDTLFHGSIGRTDLWGGNFQKITQEIFE